MKLDVLIRGGTVYDGVSTGPTMTDVGVLDGKTVLPTALNRDPKASASSSAATFNSDVRAARVIEAAGLAVLPGFIDVHSHSDLAWLVWPNATSKLLSGVTTDVSGNCGCSGFPLSGETLARRRAEYARYGLTIDWTTAAEYFQRLAGTPCGVNRAVLAGHGNLRGVTVGYGNVRADAEQIGRMRALLEEAMSAGAFGLSSGLIYPPGCWADADELASLAEVVRAADGFYSSHIRSESDGLLEAVDEFIGVLERTGCRGLLSHIKTMGRPNWHKIDAMGDRLAKARERGVRVWADRYPYTASCTGLSAILLPKWVIEGTTQHVLARLIDPRDRRRILEELSARPDAAKFCDEVLAINFSRPGLEPLAGKTLTEIGEIVGKPPLEAAMDILVEDRLETEAMHFCMSDENLGRIYSWPFVMVGSDYSSRDALTPGEMCHPRAFGTPAAFLERFVREQPVCDWPTAARKLATMPADMLGLSDRGRIAPGCRADLVVLDPARVADRATYQHPRQSPAGIPFVLVNGVVAVDKGKFTGSLAGQVLRKT